MSPSPPLLRMEGLTKSYGEVAALQALTLGLDRFEILGLLGPNGAGKTTCLQLIMGQRTPSAGGARVLGLDCARARADVMLHVGYVPDEPTFYDHLTGRELLDFAAKLRGLNAEEERARSAPLLASLELEAALDRRPDAYSRGMKKKLALAIALQHRPRLLILDEPTSGLDPQGIRTLEALLRSQREAGVGILYSTHLLQQAEGLCDRVAILRGGRLLAEGTLPALREALPPGMDLEGAFFHLTEAKP